MADQENCVRVTRAAKKRAAVGNAEHQTVNKKRVVLGELSNLSNVGASPNPNLKNESRKPKGKLKTKMKRDLLTAAAKKDGVDNDAKSDDPQMCGPYVTEIYEYLHEMEVDPKKRPLPDYIEKIQKDVSANMRGILVDWLVEVAEEYRLVSDTLYLTISYIDRFLSLNALSRQKLQLLGVSSMFIASKYEEISPPNVEDFCYITDNTYTKDEVVKMEADILKSLKFEMGSPTEVHQGCTRLFQSFQFATRVPWILPCRIESIRLRLCQIFTFFGSCICYISSKIHNSAIKASLDFFFATGIWIQTI